MCPLSKFSTAEVRATEEGRAIGPAHERPVYRQEFDFTRGDGNAKNSEKTEGPLQLFVESGNKATKKGAFHLVTIKHMYLTCESALLQNSLLI